MQDGDIARLEARAVSLEAEEVARLQGGVIVTRRKDDESRLEERVSSLRWTLQAVSSRAGLLDGDARGQPRRWRTGDLRRLRCRGKRGRKRTSSVSIIDGRRAHALKRYFGRSVMRVVSTRQDTPADNERHSVGLK